MLNRYKELEIEHDGDMYYTEMYVGHDYNTKYLYYYCGDEQIKYIPLAVELKFDKLASKFYSEFLEQKELGYE